MALFRGTVGEGAAIEFNSFLQVWKELPLPQTIIDSPNTADMPTGSALMATCGSLSRMATEFNFDNIMTYAAREDMRKEVGEYLVRSCVQQNKGLQHTRGYVAWCQERGSQR